MKLLIQRTDDGQVNWGGAQTSADPDGMLLDGYPLSDRNAALTFKELEFDDQPTAFESAFNEQFAQLEHMDRLLSDRHTRHLMTVGLIESRGKYGVELIPAEQELEKRLFRLSFEYYFQQKHSWGRLSTGNQVEVVFTANGRKITFCEVVAVVTGADTNYLKRQRRRLERDLQSVAGHALLGATVLEYKTSENAGRTYRELRLGLNGILLHGDQNLDWIPEDILGHATAKGEKYNAWVDPYVRKPGDDKARVKPFELSCTRISYPRLPVSPAVRPELDRLPVTGRVCSFNAGKDAVWALFDDATWSSCVFRNRLDMSKWGPLVRKYLPLGFPAQFSLDLMVGTDNTRLFFMGFNPGCIEGRVSAEAEARDLKDRLLQERVMVSPYELMQKEDSLLVTSPCYAGWAEKSTVPKTLWSYAEAGIFTTEMKVPAEVSLVGKKVTFDISKALQPELRRLEGAVGQQEPMKVCAICLGTAWLTTRGGYPVAYTCKSEADEEWIREQMFQTQNFRVTAVRDGAVSVVRASDFNERLQELTVEPGEFFNAADVRCDEQGVWHCSLQGIDCQVAGESLGSTGERLRDGDIMVLVGVRKDEESLVAITRHERFVEPLSASVRMYTVRELTPECWLCRQDGQLALMLTDRRETLLLRHLQRIYGPTLPVMAGSITADGPTAAQCQFGQVACGADYRRLFTGQSMPLQVALSEQTPRVLYYDVVMTATAETLSEGPMQWVVPTEATDATGAVVCRRGEAPQQGPKHRAAWRTSGEPPTLQARVSGADKDRVTFVVDGKSVTVSGAQLHIPLDECAPLTEIFTEGSQWTLVNRAGAYELFNTCPDSLMAYTLVKMNTGGRRLRRGVRNWVVRGSNGAVAIAEVYDGEENMTLLMLKDGEYDDGIAFVAETDQIKGYELAVRLKGREAESGAMVCQPVDRLSLEDRYAVPAERWNWNHRRLPMQDCSPLFDSVCLTKLIDVRLVDNQQTVLLDRRSLIPQCELAAGDRPEGEYQMRVVGHNAQGYVLKQNDTTATLKWHEAALCPLPDDPTFREEFMPRQSLVQVALSQTADDAKPLVASWRSLMGDTIERWKQSAAIGDGQTMKIHHVGSDYLFLEFDEALLYLSARQMGIWEGYDLHRDFTAGQYIDDCVLVYDPAGQYFTVRFRDGKAPQMTAAPENFSEHDATVVRYCSSPDGCYVAFGEQGQWSAWVRADDLSWEPVPIGTRPYKLGDRVRIKVLSHNDECITASVKDCLPRPLTGPASVDAESRPQLRRFTLRENQFTWLMLLDEHSVPAILDRSDARRPLAKLVEAFKRDGSMWLAVTGVSNAMLKCSQKVMSEAFDAFAEQHPEKIQVTVLEVQAKYLLVSYGAVLGRIPHKECTGQSYLPLRELYRVGDTLECAVDSLLPAQEMFVGSVVKMYPRGMLDMLRRYRVYEGAWSVFVRVESGDERGVKVRLCSYNEHAKDGRRTQLLPYMGLIPAGELNLEGGEAVPDGQQPSPAGPDVVEWSTRMKGEYLYVRCTSINPDTGAIYLSRRTEQ